MSKRAARKVTGTLAGSSPSRSSEPALLSAPRASTLLARRILRETARFAALQTLAALLAWVANIALARLLDQHDFGVYGICTFFIGIGALLGDGGLGATLLRRRGQVSAEEYRVTFTALLMVAGTMSVALFIAAPWIGAHYHFNAAETRVLRAMSPLYLVGALRVLPYIRMERALNFSLIARIELTASVLRHVLAISIALLKGGVWALVISNLVSASIQLALAYQASPGWVGLGWSWRVFRPLIAYGGQVQALNVCAYFKDNISRAFLGRKLNAAAVGIFDFGLAYIQVPVMAVNGLARVQLPVYAKLDADDPALYDALRGAMRTALILGIPLLCALALGAPWIVSTVYGNKWAPIYPVVWGLLANMVGGLVASPLFTLLQGQGRAGLAVGVFVIWTVATWTLALLSLVFFPGDLGLVALAHSVVTVAVTIWLIAWAGRHLRRSLFASLRAPVLAGLAGVGTGALARWHGPMFMQHAALAALLCVLTYVAVLLALEGRRVVAEVRSVLAGTRTTESASAPTESQTQLEEAA